MNSPELLDFVTAAAGIDADGHALPTGGGEAGGPAAVLPPESCRPLNMWRPSQFLAWTEPPGSHFLLPCFVSRGQLTALIGQGGVGKSRIMLWLAICQILGRPWCGLDTGGDPQKWLFLGDENSIARLREDLRRMFSVLTPGEIAKVDELLRLPAALDQGDVDVWLGDPKTQNRVALTIRQEDPGVVVADPLSNLAPGDIAKPGEMKEAIRLILGLVFRAAPKAAIILLHHARTGRQNIAQGVGWDAANFAMGGKALYSSARCQINLMPGEAEDETRLVMSCGKANDCPKFSTRGLIFNPVDFNYTADPDFDADAWLADVEGRACSGNSLCTVADVVAAVRDGHTTTKALVDHLKEVYVASKRTAERLIGRAVKVGGLQQVARGKYGLGEKSQKILSQ